MKKLFFVFLGLVVMFIFYHLSEIKGISPIAILLFFVLFLIITHYIVRFLGGKGIRDLGLEKHKGSTRNLLLGYAFGFSFYLFAMIYAYSKGQIHFQGNIPIWKGTLWLIGIIALTSLSSLSEDLLTRGYFYRFVYKGKMPLFFIFGTSFFYVLNHIWRIENGYTECLMLFLMGVLYAISFIKTKTLWFTVGCHWGWNTLSLFKSQIGSLSSLKVIDSTNNWLYIIVLFIMCLFVLWFSQFLSTKENQLKK